MLYLKELELHEKEREQQELEAKKEKWYPVWWVLALIGSIAAYILFTYVAFKPGGILKKAGGVLAIIVSIVAPIALLLSFPKQWRSHIKPSTQKGCTGCAVKFIAVLFVIAFYYLIIMIPVSGAWL